MQRVGSLSPILAQRLLGAQHKRQPGRTSGPGSDKQPESSVLRKQTDPGRAAVTSAGSRMFLDPRGHEVNSEPSQTRGRVKPPSVGETTAAGASWEMSESVGWTRLWPWDVSQAVSLWATGHGVAFKLEPPPPEELLRPHTHNPNANGWKQETAVCPSGTFHAGESINVRDHSFASRGSTSPSNTMAGEY